MKHTFFLYLLLLFSTALFASEKTKLVKINRPKQSVMRDASWIERECADLLQYPRKCCCYCAVGFAGCCACSHYFQLDGEKSYQTYSFNWLHFSGLFLLHL